MRVIDIDIIKNILNDGRLNTKIATKLLYLVIIIHTTIGGTRMKYNVFKAPGLVVMVCSCNAVYVPEWASGKLQIHFHWVIILNVIKRFGWYIIVIGRCSYVRNIPVRNPRYETDTRFDDDRTEFDAKSILRVDNHYHFADKCRLITRAHVLMCTGSLCVVIFDIYHNDVVTIFIRGARNI